MYITEGANFIHITMRSFIDFKSLNETYVARPATFTIVKRRFQSLSFCAVFCINLQLAV